MTTVLLHTKLMPPRVRAPMIARPELMRKLEAGLDKKLTLVSAPTGFGKTTLSANGWPNRKYHQPG